MSKARLREQLLDAAEEGDAALRYTGACTCGSIRYVFTTRVPPADWPVRRCACTFCAGHDALYTADPEGSIEIRVEPAASLVRHRLATEAAELLACRGCGDLVAAVTPEGGARLAAVNLRRLEDPPALPHAARDTREQRLPGHARHLTPLSASSEV